MLGASRRASLRVRLLMSIEILVGYLAAVCSTVSFTPQAWKVVRTRDTSSLSAPMYVITVMGFGLWLVFGLLKGEWPLIVSNAICLILSAFILLMKLLPRPDKEAVADAFRLIGRSRWGLNSAAVPARNDLIQGRSFRDET